jgi:serine O-acetyltransferase
MAHRTIHSLSDYREFLRADLRAHDVERWHPLLALKRPELRYQRLMRRVEYSRVKRGPLNKMVAPLHRFLLLRMSIRTGITFPAGAAAEGLSIAHFGSIVVNTKTRIGRFCRIHSATNIGTAGGGVPTIGDFVYIGPGAVLYGDISVGDRAVIGANAVVNRDVPAGVTVAGAPARVIAHRDSSRVMPAWIAELMKQEHHRDNA